MILVFKFVYLVIVIFVIVIFVIVTFLMLVVPLKSATHVVQHEMIQGQISEKSFIKLKKYINFF